MSQSESRSGGNHQSSIQIIDGVPVLMRVSPSQLKTFADCPRKWWYDKRAHLPRKPPSKGQQRGTLGHKRIENHLVLGIDQRDQLELAGAHLLEPFEEWAPRHFGKLLEASGDPDAWEKHARANAALKVEESIGDLKTPDGVEIIGFSDLMLGPGYLRVDPAEPGEAVFLGEGQYRLAPDATSTTALVIDHKFKKKLAQYADTCADMNSDPQNVVYSYAALTRWPTTSQVYFAHHNHQTEGPRDTFSRGVVTKRDEVLARYGVLTDTIDGPMREIARLNKDQHVPTNANACEKFGGCDFAATCPSSPKNRFLASIPGVTRPGITLEVATQMGLIPTAPTPAAQPTPTTSTASTASKSLIEAMQEQLKANAITPVAPQATPPSATPAPQATPPSAPTAQSIPAGMAMKGQHYYVGGRLGEAMGLMGDSAVFRALGEMFMVPALTPIEPLSVDVEAPKVEPVKVEPPKPARRINIVDVPATVGAGSAINPPDANRPAANPEEREQIKAETQAKQLKALQEAAAQLQLQHVATAPAVQAVAHWGTNPAPAVPAPAAEETATLKGKRGRPRKEAAAVASGEAQTANLSGLILLIDSAVSGEGVTDLSPYVSDIHKAVCAAQTPVLPDVRLADPKGPLGYGAWRGAMAAAALASPPTGVCTISSGDLSNPIIEALSGIATIVSRGGR